MPPDLVPLIHQVAMHARAPSDAIRQREGRADMRAKDQVLLRFPQLVLSTFSGQVDKALAASWRSSSF